MKMKTLIAVRTSDSKELLVHSDFGEDQEIFGDLYISDEMENYITSELGDSYTLKIIEE